MSLQLCGQRGAKGCSDRIECNRQFQASLKQTQGCSTTRANCKTEFRAKGELLSLSLALQFLYQPLLVYGFECFIGKKVQDASCDTEPQTREKSDTLAVSEQVEVQLTYHEV